MSCVYFHTPTQETHLAGSERAWLKTLTEGIGRSAWNLDFTGWDNAKRIMAMYSTDAGDNRHAEYVPIQFEDARQDPRGIQKFLTSLNLALSARGLDFKVKGVKLHSSSVELNTTLAVGSPALQLAAKIHGWCETHAYIEGEDRAWVADIIDQGLKARIYRGALHSTDREGKPAIYDVGWERVQDLLRTRDDEPVVMSYSVCETFPNSEVIDDWYAGAEKESEHMALSEKWYELDDDEKWARAMPALRKNKPWARIAPDTLGDVYFGLPVTIHDLLAEDRDERIAAAVTKDAS